MLHHGLMPFCSHCLLAEFVRMASIIRHASPVKAGRLINQEATTWCVVTDRSDAWCKVTIHHAAAGRNGQRKEDCHVGVAEAPQHFWNQQQLIHRGLSIIPLASVIGTEMDESAIWLARVTLRPALKFSKDLVSAPSPMAFVVIWECHVVERVRLVCPRPIRVHRPGP